MKSKIQAHYEQYLKLRFLLDELNTNSPTWIANITCWKGVVEHTEVTGNISSRALRAIIDEFPQTFLGQIDEKLYLEVF